MPAMSTATPPGALNRPSVEARAVDAPAGDPPELTIDDLARVVGMSVRNLREWRALGLLPPPTMVGRSGRYGDEVVERLRTVQALQADGFPLELISRMLDAGNDLANDVLRLAGALRAPLRSDNGTLDPFELVARWGSFQPHHVTRTVDLGLVALREDGTLVFTSDRVARVGEVMSRMGMTLDEVIEATATVREHLDEIAATFEQVWLDHVWEPFVDAGMPADERPQIEALLNEMPHRAMDAVTGLFAVAMRARIEAGIARETERALGQTGN